MKLIVKNINEYPKEFWQKYYQELNNYQKHKINKLKSSKNQCLSLLGLILVSQNLNIRISQIRYHHKKPYTKSSSYFSISHKYPYTAIVISDKPVGLDLELLKELPTPTLKYLKSSNSKEALISWTRYESLIKYSLAKNHKYHTIIIDNHLIITICE